MLSLWINRSSFDFCYNDLFQIGSLSVYPHISNVEAIINIFFPWTLLDYDILFFGKLSGWTVFHESTFVCMSMSFYAVHV